VRETRVRCVTFFAPTKNQRLTWGVRYRGALQVRDILRVRYNELFAPVGVPGRRD